MYEWNDRKARTNLAKHRIAFADVFRFEWETADIRIDDDMDYGEERFVATGFIDDRVCVLVYAERGDTVRVISLRRATNEEKRRYEESI